MMKIPSQCKLCSNFNKEESLCRIHEQLPGEYGREDVKDCPSFLEDTPKNENDLNMLLKYIDEDPSSLDDAISQAVDRVLSDYETKYKVLIVGIARRKIKSIIKMVDIIDVILDRLGDQETLSGMVPSQSIRLLSELNHSMDNDLAFIMKLVNPDTKLIELQTWIDARSVNIGTNTPESSMNPFELTKLSGSSRDKVRDAIDSLLHQAYSNSDDEMIEVVEHEEIEDE